MDLLLIVPLTFELVGILKLCFSVIELAPGHGMWNQCGNTLGW